MNVTRFTSAPTYLPINHFDMRCLRLQGHEAGYSESLWLGVSHLLPGGHTGFHASSVEKHYVVLEGSVTIVTEDGETTLEPWDSCRLAPGEKRRLENHSNRPATILLAMPYLPQEATQ
jgi:quercetin dioxygenase-like cupin family protein